jgi:hypothetical protein
MADGRGDRRQLLRRTWMLALLVPAGVLLTGIVLLTTGDRRGQGTGRPGSSLATVHDGAKAAYLVLERLGHKVDRQAHPLGSYGGARLAFMLAPEVRSDSEDAAKLKQWVENGGTLVYGAAAFDPEVAALHEVLGLPDLLVMPRAKHEVGLSAAWAPAHTLSIHVVVTPKDRDQTGVAALASEAGAPVALQVDRGRGRIYVLDARVFSNSGLQQADNALFLAALAARHAGGQPVVFDEYVHGFGNVVSVLEVAPWPLRWALGAGALSLLCYGLARGRRLGTASPPPRAPRRASFEQIETLATFFAAKKDRAPALAALADWTGGSAPATPPTDDDAFVQAARGLPRKETHFRKGQAS